MSTDEDKEYGVWCTSLQSDHPQPCAAAVRSTMDLFEGIMLRKSDKCCRVSRHFKDITGNTTKSQTHRYKVKNWLLVGVGGRQYRSRGLRGTNCEV